MNTTLPENARLISLEEALAIVNSTPTTFFVVNGALREIRVIYDKPCPVIGKDYHIICWIEGLFLCLRNDDLGRFWKMRQRERVSNLCERSVDNEGVSCFAESLRQRAGGETDGAAAVFAVAGDAADGGNAHNDAPVVVVRNED